MASPQKMEQGVKGAHISILSALTLWSRGGDAGQSVVTRFTWPEVILKTPQEFTSPIKSGNTFWMVMMFFLGGGFKKILLHPEEDEGKQGPNHDKKGSMKIVAEWNLVSWMSA